MKMLDDGFDEKEKERKKQKQEILAEKGLLKERSKKRNRNKGTKEGEGKHEEKVETLRGKKGHKIRRVRKGSD